MAAALQPNPNATLKFPKLFINNEFVDPLSGKTFPTINPSTGKKIMDIPEGGKADIDRAVAAARKAFEFGSPWRTMDASARGRLLYKLSELIERDIAHLASLETLDNGKPFIFAVNDMYTAIKLLKYYAGMADKIHGRVIPTDGDLFSYTRYEPVGVCGLIVPWNFPLMLLTLKLAPCLAAGCCAIVKPAEQTPLTALALAALTKEAGFPDGVINIVTGFGEAGAALSGHMKIDKVSFTGSTEVGKLIQEAAGKSNCKRVTLEMGGKSPLIIAEDADLDVAAQIAHLGVMFNSGQCCVAASRLYVHETVYEEFCKKAVALCKNKKVGCPFVAGTEQGPQIDKEQTERILELIDSGKKEGARLLCGGKRCNGDDSFFIEPTVFADVTDEMRIAREEIFGPVQQILKYTSLDDAISRANNSCYGLAAGIVSNNVNTIQRFAQQIQAGSVWINTFLAVTAQVPFGGYKMSGIGREGGMEGILPFLEVKCVTMKTLTKTS